MHARHSDARGAGDAGDLELQALVLLGPGVEHRSDAVLLRLRVVHRAARRRCAGADCGGAHRAHVAEQRVPAQHAL